jgi:dihydrofolate reductase
MRRLIMWNLETVDGYFNGAQPWQLDFHTTVWGPELEALINEYHVHTEGLLFGRTTYEGMAAYWGAGTEKGPIADFMNRIPKTVFSSTLKEATWNNTRLIRSDAAAAVAALKQEGNGNLYVFGSAKLCDTLVRHNLFDEYRICIAPILIGTGEPLFKQGIGQQNLSLLEARALKTGAVILRYAPAPKPAAA